MNATPITALPLFRAATSDDLQSVNQVIIDAAQQHVPLIVDITQHLVGSGGKRLRPSLTLLCAQLLGYAGKRHVNLAACVELIHTATLLHDDVVDESTMRRGQDTANHIWSNQASVLVGDFLLSRAFQLMVADGSLDVLTLLSDASATISQGEVRQLEASRDLTVTQDTYIAIITAKTAALFSAACEIGAIIADKPDCRHALRQFGTALGIAFQLVDDALDYSAHQATLGKTVGDDLREGKVTLPVILAYHHGDEAERRFWMRTIEEGEVMDDDIPHAIALVAKHHSAQSAISLARSYTDQARTALISLNGEPNAHAALEECLEFCTSRQL